MDLSLESVLTLKETEEELTRKSKTACEGNKRHSHWSHKRSHPDPQPKPLRRLSPLGARQPS